MTTMHIEGSAVRFGALGSLLLLRLGGGHECVLASQV